MSEAIWVSLIGSVCTLLGVIVSSYYGNKKQSKYNNLQERIAKDERITAKLDGAVDEIKCELKTIRDYIVNDK